MSDKPLSRRQVLGALATAGSAGALVGTGTSALFTDEETFTNNSIEASESAAGVVDLSVSSHSVSHGLEYHIELPDGQADVTNNPAHIWLRAACPVPAALACAMYVSIEIECDGHWKEVAHGFAIDVFDELRAGILLCPDDPCLEPGATRKLRVEPGGVHLGNWWAYGKPHSPLEVDLEFYGEQCRHGTAADNPFGQPLDGPCTCPGSSTDRQAISYIEFCAEDASTDPHVVTSVNARDDDGDPTSVDWHVENGVDIDYVVVKSGANTPYTVYKYDSGTTSGTAAVGGSGKFTGEAGGVSGYSGPGGANQNPCQFAKDAVGDSGQFDGRSTKLEGGERP
jgi:predicted ribosomally synthesized peptide with SipW-like signal peptide